MEPEKHRFCNTNRLVDHSSGGQTSEKPSRLQHFAADPKVDERHTTVVLSSLFNGTRVFKNDVTTKINQLEDKMRDGPKDFGVLAPYASGKRTKKMWHQSGDPNDSM